LIFIELQQNLIDVENKIELFKPFRMVEVEVEVWG
jgi:hypothetical protein